MFVCFLYPAPWLDFKLEKSVKWGWSPWSAWWWPTNRSHAASGAHKWCCSQNPGYLWNRGGGWTWSLAWYHLMTNMTKPCRLAVCHFFKFHFCPQCRLRNAWCALIDAGMWLSCHVGIVLFVFRAYGPCVMRDAPCVASRRSLEQE